MSTSIIVTLCIVSFLVCVPVEQVQGSPGLVYVLRQARSNFYKVGLTRGRVADRIRNLQTGNPQRISEVYSEKVTDVGQAEKAAKDSVKSFNVFEKYQGGTEWYEVPKYQYPRFMRRIKSAIRRFRPKISSSRLNLVLLQQANTEILDTE